MVEDSWDALERHTTEHGCLHLTSESLHRPLDADALAAFLSDERLDDSEAAKHVDRSAVRTPSAANLRGCEFHQSLAGQRVLIITKIVDVVGSNDHQLTYAAERFLDLMLIRGVLLEKEDYRDIAKPAIRWAFEREFANGIGKESLRAGMEKEAFIARDGAYDVLTEEILAYLQTVELSDKEDWYLHTMRDVIEALMANPECSRAASDLGAALRNLNRVQRSKPWRETNKTWA